MRLHHTAIMASDLERSVHFYTRLFGFHVVERGEFAGGPLAFLGLEGSLIELVQGAGYPAEGVVNHIAFTVEDLAAEMERLRQAGVRFLEEALYNGRRIAFCEGPDGEIIELMQSRTV
jgi:lactoylglutathione lyase